MVYMQGVGETRQRRLISNLHYIQYTDNGVRHSFKWRTPFSFCRRWVGANNRRGSPLVEQDKTSSSLHRGRASFFQLTDQQRRVSCTQRIMSGSQGWRQKWMFLEQAPGGYFILSGPGIRVRHRVDFQSRRTVGGGWLSGGGETGWVCHSVSHLTLVILRAPAVYRQQLDRCHRLCPQTYPGPTSHFNSMPGPGSKLAGSMGLAWLIGVGVFAERSAELRKKVAAAKMFFPPWELFKRGILCNWLICYG